MPIHTRALQCARTLEYVASGAPRKLKKSQSIPEKPPKIRVSHGHLVPSPQLASKAADSPAAPGRTFARSWGRHWSRLTEGTQTTQGSQPEVWTNLLSLVTWQRRENPDEAQLIHERAHVRPRHRRVRPPRRPRLDKLEAHVDFLHFA